MMKVNSFGQGDESKFFCAFWGTMMIITIIIFPTRNILSKEDFKKSIHIHTCMQKNHLAAAEWSRTPGCPCTKQAL